MGIKCFWIEPANRARVYLRRYHSSSKDTEKCSVTDSGYHNALTFIGESAASFGVRPDHPEWGEMWVIAAQYEDAPPHEDDRWPTTCACGYSFGEDDRWQVFTEVIYRRTDTGEEMTLREAPAGAMWNAPWLAGMYAPTDDGRYLTVRCPSGRDWTIDSQASNCMMPEDRVHHCWVRHGEPPHIHVDKNGNTCGAGAGSIISGSYHGFLHNGEFT